MKEASTIVRLAPNGELRRVRPDGSGESLRVPPSAPMTEAEIEAAAVADADNPPLSEAFLARTPPLPPVRVMRRALGLTQEAFATRFHIPLGTLRDWEQGRTQPDQPARAYLAVIARDPEAVERALANVSA